MITFLVKKGFEYTVKSYLNYKQIEDICQHIQVISYSKIARISRHPQHLLICTDHERLSHPEKKILTKIWDSLKESYPGLMLYNEASRVLVRHELLQKLYELGTNRFKSYNLDDDLNEIHFPVFIRSKFEHSGNLTTLIYSHEQLEKEICKLILPRNIYRKRDLLLVEFYDSKDSNGIFKKYSVFKFNNTLIPHVLSFNHHWMVKGGIQTDNPDHYREMFSFMQSEVEKFDLRSAFEVAGIDYGRIDFVFADQSPQVWEINTNPMLWWPPKLDRQSKGNQESIKLNEEAKHIFIARFKRQMQTVLQKPGVQIKPLAFTRLAQLKLAIYKSRIQYELHKKVSDLYRKIFPNSHF